MASGISKTSDAARTRQTITFCYTVSAAVKHPEQILVCCEITMMLRYAYPGGPPQPRAALQLARRPTPLFTAVARRIADAVNFVPCREGMPLSSGAVSVPTGDGFEDG